MLDANLSSQLSTFLYAIICGASMGVLYSLFRAIRVSFHHSKIVTISADIIIMLIYALITYLFSVGFTDGFVRFYVIFGELIGFFAFILTVGRVLNIVFDFIFSALTKFVYVFKNFFSVFIKKLLKAGDKMLYNIVNKSHTCMAKKEGER